MLSNLIPVLSVGRMAMGAGFLVAPKLLCDLFFMPITPATSIAWRVVGACVFAVGAFLFLSIDKDPKPALMLGLTINSIDVVSTEIWAAEGNKEWEPVVSLGGGAPLLVLMGWVALRGVGSG
jgi:hypothetical protein